MRINLDEAIVPGFAMYRQWIGVIEMLPWAVHDLTVAMVAIGVDVADLEWRGSTSVLHPNEHMVLAEWRP